MKRVLRMLAMGSAVALSLTGLGLSPAEAATTKESLSTSQTYAMTDLYLCVNVKVTTTLSYKHSRSTTADGLNRYSISKVKFTTPATLVSFTSYDSVNHACTTRTKKVSSSKLQTNFKGYKCSYNPSISVSVSGSGPSIGASFWPSCGTKKVASYKGTAKKSRSIKVTSYGDSINFGTVQVKEWSGGKPPKPDCYGAATAVTVKVGSHTGQHTFGAAKLCPHHY